MSEGGVLHVRVMDWITDTPAEQQSNIEMFESFSKIRHLEIRLTGWTINQNSRLHVGINTVPAVLGSMITNAYMEELTIDLECMSRNATLTTFCNLISSTASTYQSLEKLTITCSGEEDMSKYSLRELGQAFRRLKSITTLKFSAMDPHHLSCILYNMQTEISCLDRCLPCLNTKQKPPCPRVLPQHSCDPYEAVPHEEDEEEEVEKRAIGEDSTKRYPKNLELHRVRLSHLTIANLIYLLVDENHSSISHLALRDSVLSTDDLGFLIYLLNGHSVLKELTLEQIRIRTFHDAPAWWNTPCTTRTVPSPPKNRSTLNHQQRLGTVRLLDCKGSRRDLETISEALVSSNHELQTLHLQYSSSETCSMTIHALNALYLSTVVRNQSNTLKQLQVSAEVGAQSCRLHQLAALLGHPLCNLQRLKLDLGAGPYNHLNMLADNLRDNVANSCLQNLSLSGDEELDITTLRSFVTKLGDAPQVKALELDFPEIMTQQRQQVLELFQANTTLEEILIHPNGDQSTAAELQLCFLGLRNRLRNRLVARPEWRMGTWKGVLQVLLKWQASSSRLGVRGRELVLTSGLWFAFMECPLMVSELEPLMED